MRTDDDLAAWREAAVVGGLPQPHLERWQPLRAGVVNLWEFEAAEYWYADGWAQLMGRNETGKSSLMALTTLIPWLADTSSDKIDTLGRSGKQFGYYVRPTGADGDRRDASASFFHGWLWVEYGRLTEEGPRFFTTLLYSSARSATPRVSLEWCTAEGGRVREGLQLTSGRDVVAAKAISSPGFTLHPSALSYKATVAGLLLGSTVDRLETIGKILKVTRTPKLGAHLDVRFVTDHLRASLPELRRSEVEQLAQGWDQLDQIRHDLERARAAADQVVRFVRTSWQPWLGARLRLEADEAAASRTRFDNVRRDEDEAKATVATAVADDRELARRIDAEQLRADGAAAAAEELRASAAYRDAQGRIQQAERAAQAMEAADRGLVAAIRDRDRAAERLADAATDANRDSVHVEDRRAAAGRESDAVRGAAGRAGLPSMDATLDLDRLEQQVTERRRAAARAGELAEVSERANELALRAEDVAGNLSGIAQESTSRAEAAWHEAQAEHDAVAAACASWATDLPQPAPELDRWLAQLPTSAEDLQHTTLAEAIRRDWHEPHHARTVQARSEAGRAEQLAQQEVTRLKQEIALLHSAGAAPPATPTLWRRRSRDDAAGAPLWRLINPAPDTPADDLAHLEAALAASGVLDAWIDPDGVTGLDTFAVGPEDMGPADVHAGRRLSSLLHPADDCGDRAPSVQAVLDGVALRGAGEDLPGIGLSVSTDGRWRNSALVGRAAPAHDQAEWLGEAARESRRRRQIETLSDELAAQHTLAAQHHTALVSATAAMETLAAALRRAPSDAELRTRLIRAVERTQASAKAQADADVAASSASAARAGADTAHARFLRFASDAALPPTRAKLAQVREALHAVDRAVTGLRHARQQLDDAAERARQSAVRRDDREHEHRELESARAAADRAHAVAVARSNALRAAVGADDTAILEQLTLLDTQSRAARRAAADLARQHLAVALRLGGARQHLSNVARRREEATAERDRAFTDFRSLVDRGVVEDLGLELPEVASSTVEHVRAQVAEVRRAVTPKQWRDGEERSRPNAEELQRLRSSLEAAAREVSTGLEKGGRALRLAPAEELVHIEVVVNSNGTVLPLRDAVVHLADTVAVLQDSYDTRVQQTLDELLGSTFLEHMRERIGAARKLISDINKVLGEHATTTSGTSMRIRLEPGHNREVLEALTGSAWMDPQVAGQIRAFLRDRVDEAKRLALDEGHVDWHDALSRQLDYRGWYDITLERRIGAAGHWGPLTARTYAEMSGGARAVMLMLPLVATLSALYRDMPQAPRPIWLDEAFDGLDVANRSMAMGLLREFDLDVLLAGPGRLVNVATVPAAAIYQVVRAPAPFPGADLTLELWAGGTLEAIDLPLSWLESTAVPAEGQDSLL